MVCGFALDGELYVAVIRLVMLICHMEKREGWDPVKRVKSFSILQCCLFRIVLHFATCPILMELSFNDDVRTT